MAKKKKTEEDVIPATNPDHVKETVLLSDQARTYRPSMFFVRKKCCG